MRLNGGQALIRALELEGVEVLFGLPGGCILPVYDPLLDSPLRHILVRHEQGAGHMAEGYAHVTGRPGVAMVTSGPAATNIVTPLCDAFMDSIPMVVITGQVPTGAIGTDAFQECDTIGITRSVTKHNELVTSAQDIPRAVREAFHIATTGRPGPVLLDIPKDIVDPRNPNSAMDWYWPTDDELREGLPGYRPTMKGHPRKIREAAEMILASERPVLYVGGGILKARAAEALRELAELCDIHVVTTLMARGAFPDSHPLCLGMPGMHGNYTAVTSMQKADLLIALGSRFDDRVTGRVGAFAPDAKIIHADIDPAELGKVRRPDVPIVGDCRLVIEDLVTAIKHLLDGGATFADRTAWKQTISGWQETHPLTYRQSEPGRRPEAAVRPRAAPRQHARRLHRRLRRRSAPDVDVAVLALRPSLHVGELGRPRHDGVRRPRRHRRQGRSARRHGLGRRRRRLLPDDRPGAGDGGGRAHPGEDRHPQQRLPRHGPPVAGDVLRGALLRGVPVARPARLQALGRGHGLRRACGSSRPRRSSRRSRRPTRSTTVLSSSSSGPTPRRRCSRWSRPVRRTTTSSPTRSSERGSSSDRTGPTSMSHHILQRHGREPGRRARPRRRVCSPGAATTSSAWRWRRPRTSASAASRSSSTSSRRRSSRSPSSCSS